MSSSLYLSITKKSLSSTLVQEGEDGKKPIYIDNKVLEEVELRYQKIEELAFADIIMVRKLRPYL